MQSKGRLKSDQRREQMLSAIQGTSVLSVRLDDIYIYIYIYIVIQRQTVSFYQNTSVWLDRLDFRSWDRNLADCNANPRFCHEETNASERNLNAYASHLFLFTYIRLTAAENSIHLMSLALR